MGSVTFNTTNGYNYRNGSYNDGGSHLVGWDSGYVRAEKFHFTTGQWPVESFSFKITTSKFDSSGNDINLRFGITVDEEYEDEHYHSENYYVNAHGTSWGWALNKNSTTTYTCSPDAYLKPNTTYCITVFPATNRGDSGYYGLLNIARNFTIDAIVQDRTACTAPTSVVLNKNIQIPGGNATLSWSGATAGRNLSILGYDVYYDTSSSGSFANKLNLSIISGTSYTVTAPSNRNTSYYYKVVTRSNYIAPEYDSPKSSAYATLKTNNLPGAPTVTLNKNKIPSTGGSVIFTVTPGSDTDGQTRTLAYSDDGGTTKKAFTSPLTLNYQNPGAGDSYTYYFYTYDGLEYSSSYVSKTVTVNVKPSITSVTGTVGTYKALGGTGVENYQLGYANTITPTISTNNKTGTITVELEYYSSNNTTIWSSSSVSRAIVQQSTISSSSSVLLNNCNVHQYITLGTANIHWRLRFRLNDGIEDSDYAYFPTNNQGENTVYYAIAQPSSVLDIYNQFANSNISGTIDGQVGTKVRFKVYNDASVPLVSATATVNNSVYNTTVEANTDQEHTYCYIDITLPEGITGGATINIKVSLTDSNNFITKTISGSVTETKIPALSSVTHGAPTIKPFTETGSFNIKTAWPFGIFSTISDGLSAFNCSTEYVESTESFKAIKLVYSSDNSATGANRVEKTLVWVKDGDSLETLMNRQDAYDWEHELGFSTYSGSRTYYCRIEIKNLFDQTITTQWCTRTFDFREPAVSPTITKIEWSENNSGPWATFGASDRIQEGIYLRFNCSFGLYTKDAVKASIILTKGADESSAFSKNYTSQQLNRASNRNVAQNSELYIYQVTGEISDTTDRGWYLKIENSNLSASSSAITTHVLRHTTPIISLDKCITNENYGKNDNYLLDYIYTVEDDGGGTLTNYLYDGTNEITGNLANVIIDTPIEGSVQVIDGYRVWEAKTISIKTTSQVNGLFSKTKTFYSNTIIVYQLSPTVAYRKNQLGINTNSPDQRATVDIHQATGKQKVLIQGVTQEGQSLIPTKFEIDASTGEIKFFKNNTLQYTINLLNGILS